MKPAAVHISPFAGSQPTYDLTMPFSFSLPWTKENAQRKYTDLIRDASSHWANWYPPKRVWVGDFGTISKKTGELLVEGNIYTHKDISQIAKEYTPLEAPESDEYRIHSYHVRGLDVGTDIGATAHGAPNLVFKSRWRFNAHRGAILLMFRPRLISVPDTFLEVALTIPALRGKTLAHRVFECPGFYTYLSNKTSETVTISLRVAEPGVAVNPAVNIGWLADGCSGVHQQAYRPGAVYTPLFCLKSLRKHLLRRDGTSSARESWEDAEVPWNDLDEEGASEPEEDSDDDDDDD